MDFLILNFELVSDGGYTGYKAAQDVTKKSPAKMCSVIAGDCQYLGLKI
ncbi:MAG: hypothetical protein RMY36_028350 [Nostoc sp. SerVER01]